MNYHNITKADMLKPIPNYENYLIDENGNVFSKNVNRFLKQGVNEKGYMTVTLYKNDVRLKTFVHRLVALAFIPNPNNLPQINHKDENKKNNNVHNLEWCDNRYNQMYGNCRKKVIKSRAWYKPNEKTKQKIALNQPRRKEVMQYDLEGNLIRIWKSQGEAGRNGFNQSKVSLCCSVKRNQHKGFIWRFKEC